MAVQWGSWHRTHHRRLAENIILLRLIDEEPGPPNENHLQDYQQCQTEWPIRQLTIVRERDLADNLAFLSCRVRNPLAVSAICVEEHPGGEGLTIRMASNTGDMTPIKLGFEGIATVLERVAAQGRANLALEELVEKVVTFDRQKILYHLRSKHTPSKSFRYSKNDKCKVPLIPRLPVPTKAISGMPRDNHEIAEVTGIVLAMQKGFSELEGMSTSRPDTQQDFKVLISIVKKCL